MCFIMSGGKILARFETPAHRFLFPDVPPAKGELQQAQLNKSRKYQVSLIETSLLLASQLLCLDQLTIVQCSVLEDVHVCII